MRSSILLRAHACLLGLAICSCAIHCFAQGTSVTFSDDDRPTQSSVDCGSDDCQCESACDGCSDPDCVRCRHRILGQRCLCKLKGNCQCRLKAKRACNDGCCESCETCQSGNACESCDSCDSCSGHRSLRIRPAHPIAPGPATGLRLMQRGPACQGGCDNGCQECRQTVRDRVALLSRVASIRQHHSACSTCGDNECDGCQTEACDQCGSNECDGCKGRIGTRAAGLLTSLRHGYRDSARGCDQCGSSQCDGCQKKACDQCGNGECDGCNGHLGNRGLLSAVGHQGRGIRGAGVGNMGLRDGSAMGCGRPGCGVGGRRCSACTGHGLRGEIPHTEPPFGPSAQAPTYAYPYYTTRAPRDFLMANPPSIGW